MNGTREQTEAISEVTGLVVADNPLLSRLREVIEELVSLHRELALLLSAEKEAKVSAWFSSDDTTVTGRDRHAEYNALPNTLEILKIKGEIAAFTEERDFLRLLADPIVRVGA